MKVPVNIFSGFLGAGKTTLIKNILKQCPERKFAIVVNEFGAVSIDGRILSENDSGKVDVINVTGGPIAYNGDQQSAKILKMLSARAGEFDHVIVETSGLAVPTAVIQAISAPEYAGAFALDSIITVIDTPDFLNNELHDDAARSIMTEQVNAADVVVFNKIDEMTETQFYAAEEKLRKQSPMVRFVELAQKGYINQRLVLGLHLHSVRKVFSGGQLSGVTPAVAHAGGHSHDGWAAHEHGLHTHEHLHEHDPGWLSFALHCNESQPEQRISKALKTIISSEPLLRAKGFFHGTDGHHYELQSVRERIEIQSHGSSRKEEEKHSSQHAEFSSHEHPHSHEHESLCEIVFIGYNLSRERVEAALHAETGAVWH